MTSLTLNVRKGSPLHDRICNGVKDRIEASKRAYQRRHDKWKKDEELAIAYLPSREVDEARKREREAGKPQYTTIQIPYSYAVLMTTHTYWTTVFMSRTPVFQYTGRHGESQQKIQALEALQDYQLTAGMHLVPLYIWLENVGKYGVGVLGVYWDEEVAYVSEIEEREEMFLGLIPSGQKKKIKVTRRIRGYEGNKLYNVRPYDFFPDPRVPLIRHQDGEFCGCYSELGWNTILRRKEAGYYTNIEELSPKTGSAYYADGSRSGGSPQLELPSPTNYFLEGRKDKAGKKPEVVPIIECVIELIPDDWDLGTSKMPEKWVFTVTDDYALCIGAQPLAANHNRFPWQILVLEPEGFALANRGLPEILQPVQGTMDWLINAHFYNVRKTVNNQVIMDPSRTYMKDWLDSAAGGIIRVRPTAYGQDVRTMYQQVQMMDITQNHLRDMNVMEAIGQKVSGVNDQLMGMLAGGGRRSATEVRTSSTFGINRLKTQAEFFSALGWAPLSQMMVQNSQQLYDAEMKLKIVGDLIQQAGAEFVNVTPDEITGFYDFVPVDGTLPIDRFAQANLWREFFGQLRQMPEIALRYDIGRIFEWVCQLAGLKNITQFRLQVQPDAMLAAMAQQGNVVPMPGRTPGARPPTAAGPMQMPLPRQVPGTGAPG